MIALPLTMLALAWAVSMVMAVKANAENRQSKIVNRKSAWWKTALIWFVGAVVDWGASGD